MSALIFLRFPFREAAKMRYLSQEAEFKYYHNIMSEYFLGTYGGGKPKPFKYTEIQRHRFGLKSKDAAEDRQVPEMPLSFKNTDGQIFRYNLRKLGELTYHLSRAGRINDLFKHCLFNFDWLYAKVGKTIIILYVIELCALVMFLSTLFIA